MPANGQAINIQYYSRTAFNALSSKNTNTIYFVEESNGRIAIYVGASHAKYIDGITKAMVENVLTGNITSHTHSQYLTAITKAMVEGVLTGPITTHTHNQYLTAITKAMVEGVLTGTITTHTHNASSLIQNASNRLVTDVEKANWNTKQPALNGSGFVKVSGTTVTYDNKNYYPIGNINMGTNYIDFGGGNAPKISYNSALKGITIQAFSYNEVGIPTGETVFEFTSYSSDNQVIRKGELDRQKVSQIGTTKTTSMVLGSDDRNKFIQVDSSSTVNITIPKSSALNSLPIGTEIHIIRKGTGEVNINGESGVTILSHGNSKSINERYQMVTAKKVEENVWYLIGALK